MQFRDASRDEVVSVLTAAHVVWGRGRPLDEFLAFNLALADSSWGRAYSRYLVGADATGRIVSALRTDSLSAVLDARPVRVAQLGMLFTVPEARGRGHASALLEQAVERARSAGHGLALLVSLTTQRLYERLGFLALPCSETACRSALPSVWPKEPAWLVAGDDPTGAVPGLRRGGEGDLDAIAAIHAEETASQRLRIDRDPPSWEFDLLKSEMPRGRATDPDRFWVVERHGGVKAYVLLQAEPPWLLWREHGAAGDAPDCLEDLFWCALWLARRRGLDRIEGWHMPGILTLGPLYPTSTRRRTTNVVMLRSLGPAVPQPRFAREEECRFWELDAI